MECDRVAEQNAAPIASRTDGAEACPLEERGVWLRSNSVSIADDGEQAEQAGVACCGTCQTCADVRADRV